MPITSITPNQQARISELAAAASRNVVYEALDAMLLPSEVAQKKIIEKGGDFQSLIAPQFRVIVSRALNQLAGLIHPQAEQLEKYFSEVHSYKLDLTGVKFPEQSGFTTWMAVPKNLDEDRIMRDIVTKFGCKSYKWMKGIAQNIDYDAEQTRPAGIYVISHRGGDDPDVEHHGKSYDDAAESKMLFMSAKEYLLATSFHRWSTGHFMDKKNGWTRTSSLWSDGSLVEGCWTEQDHGLVLGSGDRDDRDPSCGPRELFLD